MTLATPKRLKAAPKTVQPDAEEIQAPVPVQRTRTRLPVSKAMREDTASRCVNTRQPYKTEDTKTEDTLLDSSEAPSAFAPALASVLKKVSEPVQTVKGVVAQVAKVSQARREKVIALGST